MADLEAGRECTWCRMGGVDLPPRFDEAGVMASSSTNEHCGHGSDDPRDCLECVLVATFTVRPEPLRRCLAALDEVSALIDALPQPVKDALAALDSEAP